MQTTIITDKERELVFSVPTRINLGPTYFHAG